MNNIISGLIAVGIILIIGIIYATMKFSNIRSSYDQMNREYPLISQEEDIRAVITDINPKVYGIRSGSNSAYITLNNTVKRHLYTFKKYNPDTLNVLNIIAVGAVLQKKGGSDSISIIVVYDKDSSQYYFQLYDPN